MRFRDSFLLTLFSQGILLISGFLNGVLITRNLGTVGRGEYAMIIFMVTILLVILGEGLYRSNIYLTSRDKSEKNLSQSGANLLFYNAVILSLFLILILLPEKWYSFFLPGIKPFYVYVGFGSALFFIFLRQLQGFYLGLQKYWHYNLFNVLPVLLFFLLNLISLALYGSLTTRMVLINYMTGMILTATGAAFSYFKIHRIQFHLGATLLKENFKTSWRATLAYLLVFLMVRMNVYIVNYWHGLAEAGLFAVAVNLSTLIQQVPNVACSVLLPRVSEKETANKLILTGKVAVISFAVSALAAAIFYIAGERLLVFLYKKDFAASFAPLAWLLPGIILFSVTSIYNTVLWGRGFPPVSIWVPLISVVTDLILCYFLIPLHGIVGAAQASTVSFVVYSIIILSYIFLNRKQLNAA
ncbi:MAG TPA: hypothetical protein ENH29_03770 [Bacteroidetes bacterium]|nr:hypothetical protein [Bacteroidota bacterium]